MNLKSSSNVKAEALRLGFYACGIAKAAPVGKEVANSYRQWIKNGHHADMHYLENNLEKRLDPTLLFPGAQSIIVVALNYTPAHNIPSNEYQIAAYALGKDYHDVMKSRLLQLTSRLTYLTSPLYKICVDTVPILERYWAWQAGLGFIGRNHQLIVPHAGSMFFLGEIITCATFDHYDTPIPSRCGTCHRCIDACPTGALSSTGSFDAHRCLSYQTIENRGPIDPQCCSALGTTIYGCDRCQQACPWNRFAKPTTITELQPSEALINMKRADWCHLSIETYRQLFKGSAVKRAKYEGLMRNIHAASKEDVEDTLTVLPTK